MDLIDTNIFLEILLNQEKQENCKDFLENNPDPIFMSDFSLHSIGVILFRCGQEDTFRIFVEEALLNLEIVSLPIGEYPELSGMRQKLNLDFDDAYQMSLAKNYGLRIVTMDHDFESAAPEVEVKFL